MKGDTRPSRPISPTRSGATAKIRWSSARSTRPIPACPPESRSAGTPPARASGRPSGSSPGPKPISRASAWSRPRSHPARVTLDRSTTREGSPRAASSSSSRRGQTLGRREPVQRNEDGQGPGGATPFSIRSMVPDPELWTPEKPHLYDVTLELQDGQQRRSTRSRPILDCAPIRHGKYGDEPFERILLNGKPLYLRTALDQSFNPKGLYTAPDDDFFKPRHVDRQGDGAQRPADPHQARRAAPALLGRPDRRPDHGRHAQHLAAEPRRPARPGSGRCARRSSATATIPRSSPGSRSTRRGGSANNPRITRKTATRRSGSATWSTRSANSRPRPAGRG